MTTASHTDSHDSFAIFFSGLHRRDNDAWRELMRRYTKRLIALARKKLDVRLGSKLDPEDVVSSVYRLLHARLAGKKGLRAESWEHLWAMLALLTAQRCNNWFRHFLATQKRDLDLPFLPEKDQSGDEGPIPAAHEPTPAEAAELADEVHRLMPHLDPQTARVFWLGLLGFSDAEISAEFQITDARVRIARRDCCTLLNHSLNSHRTQD